MKKLLLLLVLVITSVTALADNTTCRVYGTDNVATLSSSSAVGNGACYGDNTSWVNARVWLTKEAKEDVAVVVEVKDDVGNVIAKGVVTIKKGKKTSIASIESKALETHKTYYLSIASAFYK